MTAETVLADVMTDKATVEISAPVGGTMCAASPARNSRPNCIGSTTKLRMPVMPFSTILPSRNFQPSSVSSRVCSSCQMRSSGQPPISSSGAT